MISFIFFADAKVVFNMTRESPHRVVSIEVLTRTDDTPKYEPLDPNKYYRCITNSFVAEGGDAFYTFPEYGQNHK